MADSSSGVGSVQDKLKPFVLPKTARAVDKGLRSHPEEAPR